MSSNHVKYLRGGSGISVVERVVLKWSHVIKPPGKLWSCYISNISTGGDFAVVLNYRKGADEYGELTLFNSDGKIMWEKHYEGHISNPQLSDDGKVIAVKAGDVFMMYSKWGRSILTYNSREKGAIFSSIQHYKLSRDGRYVVLVIESEKENLLTSWHYKLILLKDGNIEWVKSSIWREFWMASISSNNAYIALVSHSEKLGKKYSHVALYTIDGKELWSTGVEGFTVKIDVSSRGEVLLSADGCKFINDGRVLWTKDDCGNASFTRDEDKIIAIRKRGYDLNDLDVVVFNRDGELLWEYQGAYRYAVSDNYYVLVGGEPGSEEVVLVSADGVVLQRIKLRELIEKEVIDIYIDVSISPEGKYFAVTTRGNREGEEACYLYFFENRDHLIRDIKEKLLKEIDELVKR